MLRKYLPLLWERENFYAILGYLALAFCIWVTLFI